MRLARNPTTDAGHAGKQDVRKRRQYATQNEGAEQRTSAALNKAPAVVTDVLHRSKPQRDDACVDDAVHYAVKISAESEPDQQHAQPLGTLFDKRRSDDAGQGITRG